MPRQKSASPAKEFSSILCFASKHSLAGGIFQRKPRADYDLAEPHFEKTHDADVAMPILK